MANKRIKKLEQAQQATGKLENKGEVFDYIRAKEFPYKETTLADYRKKLDAMNFSDLQKHAIEVASVIPNIERHRLVDRLEKQFLTKLANYQFKFQQNALPNTGGVTEQAAQSIQQILSRGR